MGGVAILPLLLALVFSVYAHSLSSTGINGTANSVSHISPATGLNPKERSRIKYPPRERGQDLPETTAPTPAVSADSAPNPNASPTATYNQSSTKAVTNASPQTPPSPPPPPTLGGSDIASESTCPGQANVAATTTVLTCMTSYARTFHGLNSVSANGSLMAAATSKAVDINNCGFSHTACNRAFDYWFGASGYTGRCRAENIAQGQQTPNEVFVAWMNSSGHRANILNALYRDIGVAAVSGNNGITWVMELGGCP